MKLGLLLISLALGYKVYADAAKEKGFVKLLGLFLGAAIIAVSLAGTAYSVYHFSSKWKADCCALKDKDGHSFSVQLAPAPVEAKK